MSHISRINIPSIALTNELIGGSTPSSGRQIKRDTSEFAGAIRSNVTAS